MERSETVCDTNVQYFSTEYCTSVNEETVEHNMVL